MRALAVPEASFSPPSPSLSLHSLHAQYRLAPPPSILPPPPAQSLFEIPRHPEYDLHVTEVTGEAHSELTAQDDALTDYTGYRVYSSCSKLMALLLLHLFPQPPPLPNAEPLSVCELGAGLGTTSVLEMLVHRELWPVENRRLVHIVPLEQ